MVSETVQETENPVSTVVKTEVDVQNETVEEESDSEKKDLPEKKCEEISDNRTAEETPATKVSFQERIIWRFCQVSRQTSNLYFVRSSYFGLRRLCSLNICVNKYSCYSK